MKNGTVEKIIIVILALATAIATATAVKMKQSSGKANETQPAQQVCQPAQAVAPTQAGQPAAAADDKCFGDALDVIHARTSVREYADKPIPADMLTTLVKAGMAAPTAGNRQPWYFVVVTDRNMLNTLGEHPHGAMLKTAGAAIAVVGAPEEGLRGASGEMWIQDCSAATENILIAVEALGLGAVWLGVYPVPERIAAVSSALGIPEGYVPLSLISIGWPQNKPAPKDKYKPEKIFNDRWGNGI